MTDDDEEFSDVDYDFVRCPTCKGAGTVNPLTAPRGFFCAVTTTCPDCEGSGECP